MVVMIVRKSRLFCGGSFLPHFVLPNGTWNGDYFLALIPFCRTKANMGLTVMGLFSA